MNRLFKKCMIVSAVVTLPLTLGEGGLLLSVLVAGAAVDMFHGNIFLQFLVIVGMFLIFIIPVTFVAWLMYLTCKFFTDMSEDDVKPKPTSKALVVPNPRPVFVNDKIIDGEWSEVD